MNTIRKERSTPLIMKASTFFFGLAAGTVAAAVTVLYSTPQSGSELRTSVKSASTDMKEMFQDVKDKISEFKSIHFKTVLRKQKKLSLDAVDGIKESIEQWQQATEPNKERMERELFRN